MNQYLMTRGTKFLLITALFSIVAALLLAWNTPATGYEISIYRSTPILFWILYGYSVCVSVILLLQIISKRVESSMLTKLVFLLIFINGIVLTALHTIRGYFLFDVMGDVGSHIGVLNNLISSGIINSRYPLMYIETATSHLLTNLPVNYLIQVNSIIFYVILICGVYLLAREVCASKSEVYLVTLLVSFYPFGSASYMASSSLAMYVPYLQALFIIPLFMYLVFKLINQQRNIRIILICASLFSISILFYHLLISVFLAIFLLCVLIQQIIASVKGNTGNISIKALLSLLSISVLSFALWTLITSLIKTPVLSFYNLLFTDTSESIRLQKTETLASSLFSGNYTPLEIIDILIKQLGIVAILFIIFLLIIPYIWRKINDDETYKNLVSLSLFAVLMSGFVILPFLTSSVSYEMGRPMFLIILVGVIYAGIYFSHLCISIFQDHTDHSRYKKILPMLGILLGIALICLSIISVYASTDTYQSSKQTTYGLVEGMDHYLTYHNPNFDTVQVGFFTPARFAQALYSSTYIRHDAYDYTYKSIEYVDSAPNNFNYSTSQLHLGNEYSSITYLAILDSTVEQFMQKARDEKLHQSTMTPTALYQLEYDDSVNKYYTNPSIVYYLIMAENKA
ncbi:MAG: hypothetical protein PHG64_11520 [Paludibacter sp.]|nr:hypothetical protein [Paludibacter sp.]